MPHRDPVNRRCPRSSSNISHQEPLVATSETFGDLSYMPSAAAAGDAVGWGAVVGMIAKHEAWDEGHRA